MDVNQRVAAALSLEVGQVEAAAALLKEGATVPFIAHYRKERTGGLDEAKLAALKAKLDEFGDDEGRRETALKSIRDGGKLTPELEEKLKNAASRDEIEDLFMAFRSRRRTRSSAARHKGLKPLAELILKQESSTTSPDELVKPFISEEKQVKDAQDALSGARDIIAERIAEDPEARSIARALLLQEGKVTTKARENIDLTRGKYASFASAAEPIGKIPGYRLLAAMRGAADKQLFLTFDAPKDKVLEQLKAKFITNAEAPLKAELSLAIEESYERLLGPSLDNDLRLELKGRAESDAIDVFAKNLRAILLQAPLGAKPVLGVMAAAKSAWKVVVVGADGKPAATATLHPGKDEDEKKKASDELLKLIRENNIAAVAIAHNSGAKDADQLLRVLLATPELKDIARVQVHEGVSSAYASTAASREELHEADNALRTALSLGRRLQDPLSEIMKLDLKTIPLGQYQHDVDQPALARKLDEAARSVVAQVGVDVNTAPEHVLRYVPGLNSELARAIAATRKEKGAFKTREDYKGVAGFDTKVFEHAAGFLRIPGADNKLDATRLHPEVYAGADAAAVDAQLAAPDTRGPFVKPEYNDDIKEIGDLKEGMVLNGIVTNLAQFGAFVDVGVHQDGLVHLSAITHKFIHDPSEVLTTGQHVKVKVLSVDSEKKRISLSIKALEETQRRQPRGPRGPRREGAPAEGAAPAAAATGQPEGQRGERRPRRFDRPRGPRRDARPAGGAPAPAGAPAPVGGAAPAAATPASGGAPPRRDGRFGGGDRRGGSGPGGGGDRRGGERGPRTPERKPGQPDFSKFFVKSKRKEKEKRTQQDGGASRDEVRAQMKHNHESGTSLADLLKQAGFEQE